MIHWTIFFPYMCYYCIFFYFSISNISKMFFNPSFQITFCLSNIYLLAILGTDLIMWEDIYIYIYILDDPATFCCGTVQLHGWGISVFPKTTVSTLLSVIIFTGAHKQHQWYNYSYHRVQNSHQLFRKPWFDTINSEYFYRLPFLYGC